MSNVAKMAVVRQLDDEYETTQLNPKYADPKGPKKDKESSAENIEKLVDKIPEKDQLRLRIATCEAIVDDIIANNIEQNDGNADVEVIEEEIKPVVEKAVALHIVPRQMMDKIRPMIAKHLRLRDPMVALHAKVAHYLTDSVIRMEEEDCVISEVLDDKPADTGFDIQEETVTPTKPSVDSWKPRKKWSMEEDEKKEEDDKKNDEEKKDDESSSSDDNDESSKDDDKEEKDTKEEKTDDKEDVKVDADLPKQVEDSMRFLAASAVNHRKATALVSRKIGGVMLVNCLYALRNCLPESYKRKYRMN